MPHLDNQRNSHSVAIRPDPFIRLLAILQPQISLALLDIRFGFQVPAPVRFHLPYRSHRKEPKVEDSSVALNSFRIVPGM